MNPSHLLDQAETLIRPPPRGAPRFADKRRAISSAYYAVFHKVAGVAAFELVGDAYWGSPRYELVYRAVSHSGIRKLAKSILKPPQKSHQRFWPKGGFGADMQAFANTFEELIQARHDADYRPDFKPTTAEVRALIQNARTAIDRLEGAANEERSLFVTILICPPRSE